MKSMNLLFNQQTNYIIMKNTIISLFKGYTDLQPAESTLNIVAELIRTDAKLAEYTRLHRECLQKQQASAAAYLKATCPCFAVSVRFVGGKRKEHIGEWTHLCMADFDHIPAERMEECRRLVATDCHTVLAYTTISGTGLRVVAAYEAAPRFNPRSEQELHVLAFRQMNEHYARLTGLPYDEKCKNSTRLSGLAHDPEVYFQPKATCFVVSKPKPEAHPARLKKEQALLKKAILAAEAELANEGVVYTEHHHNEYIMRMGYLLNAYGAGQVAATQWAVKRFADYQGDVAGIFTSCYRQTEEHGTRRLPGRKKGEQTESRNGVSVEDMEQFLLSQGRFRKNTVTGRYEFAPEGTDDFYELTDRDVNSLWRRLCKDKGNVRLMDLRTVLLSDFVELYNPFKHYFEALPAWDGQRDYIAELAAQVHVKEGSDLFAGFFKKWLVAMVASLLDEEVVNHEILVLIGRQGIYKTTWLNNLLPAELRRYFYLKTNSRRITKDDLLTLSEFAIVCLEELDEMDAQEVSQLKALTTMRHVNERAAYAHFKEMRPHIASFCGTSNNLHILTDLSGNRRWMPFEVECIDSPYDHPVDYAGVYAQAYTLLRQGFHYWLTEEEITALNRHNRNFEVPCLERELILTHYRRPTPGETAIFVTTAQILARINFGIRQKLSPVKIGLVMKQEGFESLRYGGKRGYRVVELNGDEIYRNQQTMGRVL